MFRYMYISSKSEFRVVCIESVRLLVKQFNPAVSKPFIPSPWQVLQNKFMMHDIRNKIKINLNYVSIIKTNRQTETNDSHESKAAATTAAAVAVINSKQKIVS